MIEYDTKELIESFAIKEPLIYKTIEDIGHFNDCGALTYITEIVEYEYMIYFLKQTIWFKFNPYLKTVEFKTKFQWMLEGNKI